MSDEWPKAPAREAERRESSQKFKAARALVAHILGKVVPPIEEEEVPRKSSKYPPILKEKKNE
jgi:hypothetical protein